MWANKHKKEDEKQFAQYALDDINAAIEHDKRAIYYAVKADILNDLKRKDEARETIKKARELSPDDLDIIKVMNKI